MVNKEDSRTFGAGGVAFVTQLVQALYFLIHTAINITVFLRKGDLVIPTL